jgi:capsular polysaccharide biosynthesis protein
LNEQVLDVRGTYRLIRRRWRTIVVFVLLGVIAAVAYDVTARPEYRASSLVLLPAPSATTSGTGSTTSRGVTTVAKIATSAAVLLPAGHKVAPSASLAALQQRVTTSDPANGVLKITATGSTPGRAEALANAVADHVVTFVTTSGSAASSTVVAALEAEVKQLDGQVADVQKEIAAANARLVAEGATTTAGRQETHLVATLTSEQSSLTLQLNSLQSQIADAQLEQLTEDQGTEVIQRATTATPPSIVALSLPPLGGAIAGLLVGALFVVARHRRDPRLRTRDAVARALGSPVMLSLPVTMRRTTDEWVNLFERYQPASLEQWNIRRALRELGVADDSRSNLAILALAGDAAALSQGVLVALAAAASGTKTVFSLVADGEKAAALQAACFRFEHEDRNPRPGLEIRVGGQAAEGSTGLTVTALVLDPESPTLTAAGRPKGITVLSVSAGFASAEQLARVAIAASDGDEPIRGVFVANPVSGDQTVGTLTETSARASLVDLRRTMGAKSGLASGRAR